jgi:hypothetical protein
MMFRMKRTRWVSLGLLLGVLLLLPLPASAGNLWDRMPTEGFWADVLAWFGLGPVWIEMTSPYIDPDGQPGSSGSGSENGETSPYIDPNGQPGSSPPSTEDGETSPMVDPLGQP